MNAMLSPDAPWTGAASFAIDVVAKATLLLLVAYGLHGLLRRHSVLACSVLWNACLLGLLALPAAEWAFPRLRLDWLPAAVAARTVPKAVERVVEPIAAPGLKPPIEAAPLPHPVANATALPRSVVLAPALPEPTARSVWLPLALGVYLLVSLVLLARLALSLWAVARLARASTALNDERWSGALEGWRKRMKIAAQVRLLCSERIDVPIVLGCLRPAIVLPAGLAERLSPAQVDAVLLHELAHVRRGDYGWNLLRRVVQAAYWPHPFAWPLGRILGSLREQACDDLCVHWMGDRQEYRATLLDVATRLVRPAGVALGMAMARTTKLGARLARIEQTRGSANCRLAALARLAVAASVLAVAGVLGSVELSRARVQAAQGEEPKTQAPAAEPKQPSPDQPGAEAKKPEPGAQPKSVSVPPAAPKAEARPDQPAGGREVVRVKTEKPKRGPFTVTTTHQGTIKSFAPRAVSARVAGVIKSRNVDVGDKVKADQVLAEISAPDVVAESKIKAVLLNQAKAQLRQAEAAVQVARAALESAGATRDQAEAELKAAEGRVRFTSKQKERFMELLKQKAIDDKLVDEKIEQGAGAEAARDSARARVAVTLASTSQGKAELAGAEAALEAAHDKLEIAVVEQMAAKEREAATRVVAPIDGVIVRVNAEVGQSTSPSASEPLFVVANSARVTVVIDVPEQFAMRVDVGDPARVYVSALDKTFDGKVSRTAWALDAKYRTLPVEIDLPNPDGRLRPGFNASATIELEVVPNVLTVPIEAVLTKPVVGNGVRSWVGYLDKDSQLQTRNVRLGRVGDDRVEILHGLDGNEDLVVPLGTGPRPPEGVLEGDNSPRHDAKTGPLKSPIVRY